MGDSRPTHDISALESQVNSMRRNTVSQNSRKQYNGSIIRFILWIWQNKINLLSTEFLSDAASLENATEKNKKLFIKQYISEAPHNPPPIILDAITATDFMTWTISQKKSNGTDIGFDSHNTNRAALFNLFRDYRTQMSQSLASEIKNTFIGLKRTIISNQQSGTEPIKVGKSPLSFDLYRKMSYNMLKKDGKEYIFARCFQVICWNLMARPGNVFSICYNHIEWFGDSLCIYFAHMKNDQLGDRPRDPRHVYANPVIPEICPVLALGMYWISTEFDLSDRKLFPGNNQYERFRKILDKFLEVDFALELTRRGMNAHDLGLHSYRKGCATYTASGSTSCPSSSAISLRAGWTLPGVQDTYLRYEGAGDMYVGRTASGLPTDNVDFALLPPHFKTVTQMVNRAIDMCFNGLPLNLRRVGEFAVASIIYHANYLKENLLPQHSIFRSVIFQDQEMFNELSALVSINSDDFICATGIPPHISLLKKMNDMADGTVKVLGALNEKRIEIVADIVQELENRAIGAGTVTFDGLDQRISACLASSGLTDLIHRLGNGNATESVENSIEADNLPTTLYFWGGHQRRVPEDFKFPDCPVTEIWKLWNCGDFNQNICSYKYFEPVDMPNKDLRRRLSDLKYLMKKIILRGRELNLSLQISNIDQAVVFFNQCQDAIQVPAESDGKRRRRRGQLSWRTVVNIMRKSQNT